MNNNNNYYYSVQVVVVGQMTHLIRWIPQPTLMCHGTSLISSCYCSLVFMWVLEYIDNI